VVVEDLRLAFIAGRRRWMAWRATPVPPSALKVGARGAAVGIARAIEQPMKGPFTEEPSVFHEIIRSEKTKKVDPSVPRWIVSVRNITATPFELVGDDGSRLIVEPTIAVHTLEPVVITPTEGHRWSEARVAPNDRIVVYGMVDETGEIDTAGYRATPITVPRIRGTMEEPLVISRARKA